jgi:hypothetical protein
MAAIAFCAGNAMLSAQSDPDETVNSVISESIDQLGELTAKLQDAIIYKAPAEEEENIIWALEYLDNYTSIMAQWILYKAPDEIAPDAGLDFSNKEAPEENLTDLVKMNSNNL